MRIKIVKWLSISALLFAVLFWQSVASYGLALDLFVSMSALLVALQALRARKWGWIAAFAVIAVLFGVFATAALVGQPEPPVRLAGGFGLALIIATIIAFGGSLIALKSQPQYSIASITDRNPNSLAL